MAVQFQDYYELLGVRRDASTEEIHKVYRRLARQFHPDVNKSRDAESKFKRIGEAWEVLRDPEKRRRYDALGADWKAGQEFTPPADWAEQFFRGGAGAGTRDRRSGSRRTRRPPPDETAFSDFFETLFGGARGSAGFGGRGRRSPMDGMHFETFGQDVAEAGAGANLETDLTISLEDACRGATKTIRLTREEPGPDGRLRTATHTYQVRIPAGTVEGKTIRLAGQGGSGAGGQPGDLHLHVHVAEHPRFKIAGRDLTTELPVTPWEAALGGTVHLATVEGDVRLRIPPGSSSGRVLRLRGQGLPHGTGTERGDLLVELKIAVPATLSAEERQLLEKLAHVSRFNPRSG